MCSSVIELFCFPYILESNLLTGGNSYKTIFLMSESRRLENLVNEVYRTWSRRMMTGFTPASISRPNSSSVLQAVLFSRIAMPSSNLAS